MTPLLSKMTPRDQSSHSVAMLHAQRPLRSACKGDDEQRGWTMVKSRCVV
jgi:hypothetical protein